MQEEEDSYYYHQQQLPTGSQADGVQSPVPGANSQKPSEPLHRVQAAPHRRHAGHRASELHPEPDGPAHG